MAPVEASDVVRQAGPCRHRPTVYTENHPSSAITSNKETGMKLRSVFFAATASVLLASPAFAGVRSVTGSSTNHNSAGTIFYVSDTAADSDRAYGNWGGTSSNRLENGSGSGTTVSKPVSSVGSHRACVSLNFNPDPCSIWGS